MPLLNDAAALYLGDQTVTAVYLGTEQVWPPPAPTIRIVDNWGSFTFGVGKIVARTQWTDADVPAGLVDGKFYRVVIDGTDVDLIVKYNAGRGGFTGAGTTGLDARGYFSVSGADADGTERFAAVSAVVPAGVAQHTVELLETKVIAAGVWNYYVGVGSGRLFYRSNPIDAGWHEADAAGTNLTPVFRQYVGQPMYLTVNGAQSPTIPMPAPSFGYYTSVRGESAFRDWVIALGLADGTPVHVRFVLA